MGLFVTTHNHYHQHHVHHYPGNSEQFRAILYSLELLAKGIKDMIDKVVQDLMDQAKRNTSFEASFDLAFKALQAQVGTLQSQISALAVGGLTDAEKAQISATTSDLANSITTLQNDVPAGTSAAAAPPSEPPPAAPPSEPPPAAPPSEPPPAAPQT